MIFIIHTAAAKGAGLKTHKMFDGLTFAAEHFFKFFNSTFFRDRGSRLTVELLSLKKLTAEDGHAFWRLYAKLHTV